MRSTSIGLTVALALAASALEAQRVPAGLRVVKQRVYAGGSAVLSVPQGEFGEFVGEGGGIAAYLAYHPGGGLLGFRFDGALVIYGLERDGHHWPETRSDVIWFGGVGPVLSLGRAPFTPYLNAGVGLSHFATTWSSPGYADATVGHTTAAWYAGGGLRLELSRGRVPISLDLSARYIANGTATYLAPNVFVDTRDGLVPATLRSEANLMLFQLGVSAAFP